MVRIAEFENEGNIYHVFFHEGTGTLNYFYRNEDTQDVECWTAPYNVAKKYVGGVGSIEEFKEDCKVFWQFLWSSQNHLPLIDKVLRLQVFPSSFWNDCIQKDFYGYNVEAITLG